MGEEVLVEDQIRDAKALIEILDADGASPSLAAWYYYEDGESWQLVLAGAFFDNLLGVHGGQSQAYRKVVDAFAKGTFSSLSIADVKLVKSEDELPKTIGTFITTPSKGFVRAHFTNNFVNGIFLKDLLLIRSA